VCCHVFVLEFRIVLFFVFHFIIFIVINEIFLEKIIRITLMFICKLLTLEINLLVLYITC
jgi:hypothetical protein